MIKILQTFVVFLCNLSNSCFQMILKIISPQLKVVLPHLKLTNSCMYLYQLCWTKSLGKSLLVQLKDFCWKCLPHSTSCSLGQGNCSTSLPTHEKISQAVTGCICKRCSRLLTSCQQAVIMLLSSCQFSSQLQVVLNNLISSCRMNNLVTT